MLLPLFLNVNVLLAKKLNVNATEVEKKLLTIVGKPKETSAKKITKSITVLVIPTIAKRSFSACFFAGFVMIILLDEIKWTALGLVKNTSDIFAYDSQ